MLVGEGREGLDPKSYPALCLLPFTADQIRRYLESCLGSLARAGTLATWPRIQARWTHNRKGAISGYPR